MCVSDKHSTLLLQDIGYRVKSFDMTGLKVYFMTINSRVNVIKLFTAVIFVVS